MRNYLALTKPSITWLILMSTALAAFSALLPLGGWTACMSW